MADHVDHQLRLFARLTCFDHRIDKSPEKSLGKASLELAKFFVGARQCGED